VSKERLCVVPEDREILREAVAVLGLEAVLHVRHQPLERGCQLLLPLGRGGLLLDDGRLPRGEVGGVGEDEREQRPRERPLVGAVLKDNHVEQHGELRRKELGLAREVRGERSLDGRVAVVRRGGKVEGG